MDGIGLFSAYLSFGSPAIPPSAHTPMRGASGLYLALASPTYFIMPALLPPVMNHGLSDRVPSIIPRMILSLCSVGSLKCAAPPVTMCSRSRRDRASERASETGYQCASVRGGMRMDRDAKHMGVLLCLQATCDDHIWAWQCPHLVNHIEWSVPAEMICV